MLIPKPFFLYCFKICRLMQGIAEYIGRDCAINTSWGKMYFLLKPLLHRYSF